MRPLEGVPVSISGVLPNRQQLGPRDRHARRAGDVERQGEGGHLRAKERHLEQTLLSQPPEGSSPADSWISDLEPPEQRRGLSLWWEPPSLWYLVTAAKQILSTPGHTEGLLTLKNRSLFIRNSYLTLYLVWPSCRGSRSVLCSPRTKSTTTDG